MKMAAERRKIKFPKRKERIDMTLNEFVQNPTGKYSSYFSRRDRIKKDLEHRFSVIMSKFSKNFSYKVYRDGESYIFHYKVPSEEYGDKMYYDVFLEFEPSDKDDADLPSLLGYKLRLFSNSPNFTFTYTYVIYNSDMLSERAIGKCNDKALKEEPRVRNPIESLGFEKSCYFAAMHLKSSRLYYKKNVDAEKWSPSVMDRVKSDGQKLAEYNAAKKKVSDEKKKEQQEKRKANNEKAKRDIEARRVRRGIGNRKK
jgi:hypothetical protein